MPTEVTLNLPDSAQYHFEFLIAEASDGSKAWFAGHASASAPGGWSYTLGGGDLAGKQITSVYTLEHTGAVIGATSTLAQRSTLVRNEFSGTQLSADKISVADFNDVSAATGVVGATNMVDFIDLKEVNLSNIPDYSGDVWANEGPFVTYNGAISFDGTRHYFISAHDGTVPGGWAAHDTISDHQIDLGSWTFDRQVLAKIDLTGAFISSSNDAVNLLIDGDFTQPLGEVWYDWTNAGALFSDAPGTIPGDMASLPVGTDLFQSISALGNGTYKLTFLARNPSPNDAHLVFALQQAGGISVNKLMELGLAKEVILPANSDFIPVELTFTVSSPDFSVNEFYFSNSYVFPESSIPNSVNPPGTVIEVADALLIAYDPATDANTAPVITSIGGGDTADIGITENSVDVITVTAADPDAGTTLSYSISGGADAAKFQINATTGALSFKAAPNFEAPTDAGGNNVYDVSVQVSDGSLTDTQAIAVTVTNVNEKPLGSAVMLSQLGGTSTRALNASDITDPTTQFYWDPANGGNGHIYEFVLGNGTDSTFEQMRSNAASHYVTGVQGYLATITSSAETVFLRPHFNDRCWWLGGSDAQTEGQWRWVTGPEAGQLISYSDWAPGEPNDIGGEDYLIIANWTGGHWVDVQTRNVDYLVEYSGDVTINTPDVTATGSAFTQGRTLYADGSQITDPDGVGAITWQWQRSADNGATWTDISGATQGSYTLARADVGKLVRSEASYTDNGGTLETVFSAASAAVAGINAAPVITSNGGGATTAASIAENTGAVTTVTATDPDAGTTLSYSISGGGDASLFQINATTGALSFKTAPNFEAPGDAGANNVYDVTVQVSDGSLTDTQALAVTVTNVNEQPSGSVTITGTGTVGSLLAASHNVVDPDGPGTGGYQWTRNGTNITGATGANYTLTNADAGQAIGVKLTYTDGGGFRQSVASGALSVASLAPGVRIAGADTTTGEDGNAAVFSVSLDKAPVDPVTLVFSVSDGSEGSLAVTSLTFTSANWNVAQTLTITGVDDYLNDGTQTYALRTTIDTRDLSYIRLTVADVTLSNLDDGQDKPLFLYGDNEINYLTGGNGNDRIYAAGNMDELRGGRGDDRLYGEQDNDRLYGGEGLDQLYGGYDDDELYGDAGNDKLYGEAGDDRLEGGIGNDILDGGTGVDTMVGGAGNDTYYVDDTGDVIDDQGASTDVDTVLVLATIQYTLAANVENAALGKDSGDSGLSGNTLANDLTGNSGSNALAGGGGNDALDGGAGNDALNGGTGNDVLVGGLGNDKINGGTGVDTADFSDAQGNVSVDLGTNRATGDGTDALSSIENVAVGGGDDVVTGNAGANTLNGGSGNDTLTGGDGSDVLVGGTGGDTLYAGTGDDTVNAGSGDDVIVGGDGAGNDRYSGGTGVDTIRYTSAKAGIVVDLSAIKDHAASIAAGDAAGIGVDQLSGIENVIAGDYADRITGNSAANVLRGMQGRDVMNGGAGSDRLVGGTGRDSLTGGTGADSFVFDDGDFGGATSTLADRVLDFSKADGDRIDLKLVDANTANGANDNAFTFIGTKAFSKVAGELRFAQSSGNTYVSGDTDGNGTADFMIRLDGLHTLTGADFVL